jgi:hypothetical protein
MATQTEELRLIVKVDDPSGSVAMLKSHISQIGGGATQAQFTRFARQHDEAIRRIKEMTDLLIGGEKAMLGFVGKFGIAGAAVAAFGTIVVAGLKGLVEFADKVTDIGNKARLLNVHGAVLKNIDEQLQRVTTTTGLAERNLEGFSRAMGEMVQAGSDRHRELKEFMGGGSAAEELIQRVQSQRGREAQINEALAQAQQARANALAQEGANVDEVKLRYEKFLRLWGLDSEFALIGRIKETTQEQIETFNKQQELVKTFRENVVDFRHAVDELSASLKASFLAEGGTLNKTLELATKLVEGKGTPESAEKSIQERFDKFFPNRPRTPREGLETGRPMHFFGGGEEGKAMPLFGAIGDAGNDSKKTLTENTGELKKLNDYLTRKQLEEEGATAGNRISREGPPSGGPASPYGGPRTGSGPYGPGGPGGGSVQREAESKLGMPSFGAPSSGTVGGESFDALTRGAPSSGVLGSEGGSFGSLAQQRAPYIKWLNEHPDDKAKFAGLLLSEEPSSQGRIGTAETFFNRMISHKIPPEKMMTSVEGLASGRGVYYEPLRPGGTYSRSAAALRRNPELMRRVLGDIDTAGGGSNVSNLGTQNASLGVAARARMLQTVTAEEIRGIHDIYSRKDVHAEEHGAMTVAREREWYEKTRAAIDAKSIKIVKVNATGNVDVNIGKYADDATLGGSKLFKDTTPQAQGQMQPAQIGRDTSTNLSETTGEAFSP